MADIEALVIGEETFPFHDFGKMEPLFEDAVGEVANLETTTDRDELADLSGYDVLVDYLTDSTLTDDQRDGLLSFVEDGGGYVGVHCASDLTTTDDGGRDEPFPELRDLIGGHFVTHPEQGSFDVHVVDHHHPVSADVSRFRVWDEPYHVDVDDDVQVLARMDHPKLGDMPVAWAKEYYDGRVFYLSLGHDRPAFTCDGVRRFLANGIEWAADA